MTQSFSQLFKKYRLKAEFSTLSELGNALASKGLIYEDSIFSHWQKGTRIPQSRNILIKLIEIFVEHEVMTTVAQANEFLCSAQLGYLTEEEIAGIPGLIPNISANQTMSASLGGLVKDFRIQKNIPSLEVAYALGWKNTTQLDKIEQGIIDRPPREVIDGICRALELKEQEKNAILLAGNYLPTPEEIEKVRNANKDYLETWPYPAVLYDFCWRVILFNKKTMRILGLKTEEERIAIYNDTPTAIEMVFDPHYVQNEHLTGEEKKIWHANLFRFLLHFKNLQKSITRDQWYSDVIKKMMNNDLFREIWRKTHDAEADFLTTRYGKKIFVHPDDHTKRFQFNIFVVPLLKDPRFEMEFYNPSNPETIDFFTKEQK